MEKEEKTVLAVFAVIGVGLVTIFLKSAWNDAKKEAEEAANPPFRWTDKNRWE